MPEEKKDISKEQKGELWHIRSVSETLAFLNATEQGLAQPEADARLRALGRNVLPEAKTVGPVQLFFRQFQSPLIYILLIASIIVFFLGEHIDSYIILFVLMVNAFVGFFQEGKAQNTLAALKRFTTTDAVVIRDGKETVVPDVEVVPGDIIILREGNKVPADARLIDVSRCKIDESALTGESVPVMKDPKVMTMENAPVADQKNMVFKGTFVATGLARAVVVATGVHTVFGKISEKIITADSDAPLKKDIAGLSKFLSIAIIMVSIVVFLLGLYFGYSAERMFFTAVAVAVSLVPEGLPIVMTLILATGVYRMAKRNALVKKLQAVEALGQASIIAVDKTGTITKNELMIEKVFVAGKLFSVSGNGYEPRGGVALGEVVVEPANHPELLKMAKIATYCSDAHISFLEKEKIWKVAGDPTEAAMLVFGEKAGFSKDSLEKEEPLLLSLPFDSKIKFHATLHAVGEKTALTVVGAPETVLEKAEFIWTGTEVRKIAESDKNAFEEEVIRMSREGLRVIACAINENAGKDIELETLPALTLIGLFGMRDVLRENVAESVRVVRENGIKVVMITGDHRVTAEAIAKEAGIFKTGDKILIGKEIEEMTVKDLARRIGPVSVFARVTPEHKLKIIEAYSLRGDIIAMTGDGVNDALSLVAADLGVAMGNIGTEVTKEAADIVLLDDNFKSIIAAVEEGRNIYASIKKVILYLFSTGIGELFVVIGALIFLLPLPLLPSQILWLNLVTDGFLVVAMALEPREKLSGRKAHGHNKFFITRTSFVRMIIMGLVMTVGTLYLFNTAYIHDFVKGSTVALTTLAIFQWFNAWNCRSENRSIFSRDIFSNPHLVAASFTVIVLQIFAVYTPFLQKVLHTSPLDMRDWFIIVCVSASVILVEEVRKIIARSMEA